MEAIKREKHTFDATGQKVGRLATQIATLLQGKHRPTYVPHVDSGDFVEIENVDQLSIDPKKAEQKMYHSHSLHPGGLKTISLKKLFAKSPEAVLEKAVSRMLPKNKLRADRMKRLTFKK